MSTNLQPVVLAMATLLILSQASPLEYFSFARPGHSPWLTKLTEQENDDVKRHCGIETHGNNKEQEFKIAGGFRAEVGQFPWAVSLAFDGQSSCGGTIISPRHFISAAHCFFTYTDKTLPCKNMKPLENLFDMEVHYGGTCTRAEQGTHCTGRNTRVVRIRKVRFLRKFHDEECEKGHDFAIAEIDGQLEFDDHAKPICLPSKQIHNLKAYSTFTNYGFGQNYGGIRSAFLQYIDLPKDSVYKCLKPHTDTVCVRTTGKRIGICHGDSGSGFQARRISDTRIVLMGPHSSGDGCGNGNVFKSTHVVHHLEDVCNETGVCYD
ncbi:hypothetical protein QR680_010545 [Steinernema hermaphroditum]|uniref:Peptidase S1 domain-containing protein n=1 Tax=Steinernema hermaphroditum TaxID=289476 RepID=A0AA39IPE7_9BILA|nr:hypothetical protein QR680_010545 [Steinernema hermaphroditum]